MRSGAAVLAALAAAAVLAVLVVAAGDERDVAHAVGLPAIGPAGTLAQGQQLCRRDIEVPVAFERVRVVTTTKGLPGPPLEVRVSRSGRATRAARVPGGYQGTVEARVGHVPAGATVSVCVRNLGVREVVLLGIPPGVLLGDLGDTNVQVEFAVVFARDRAVSTLSQVPEMMRRAAHLQARRAVGAVAPAGGRRARPAGAARRGPAREHRAARARTRRRRTTPPPHPRLRDRRPSRRSRASSRVAVSPRRRRGPSVPG